MAYKKRSKSEKVKQKQKQKQKQTVNVYIGTKGTGTGRKRRKAAPSHRSKPSGGVQPFYGLLNLTPPLNPSNDLGNIVDKVVSRLNIAATDRPIARGERFRQGAVPTVSIGVGTTESGTAPVPPIVMASEASRVSSAGAFRPQHATSAQDIRRSPAIMTELRERLAVTGKGLTPSAQPADKGDPFDIHHTGSVPSPSDATIVAPAGAFNRGLDTASVGAETRVVGGLVSALPRDDMSLLTGTPSIQETLLESGSDLSEPDEGGELKPEVTRKPSKLFKQHQELRIPRDFRTEGGRAAPLDYSRPVASQYLPQLNKTGAAVRQSLLGGAEDRVRTGFSQYGGADPTPEEISASVAMFV